MQQLVIIGAGGFGRELLKLIRDIQLSGHIELDVLGFVDPLGVGESVHQLQVLGDDHWALSQLDTDIRFVIASGSSITRKKIAEKFEGAGFQSLELIHPSVSISPYIQIGKGTIICEGCILTTDIQVGRYTVLNLHTTLGHDVVIEDFVTVAPGVNISGSVHIGALSEIGTGATILPGLSLGEACILGAGGVATKNLEGHRKYVGVPAKLLETPFDKPSSE